MNNTLTTDDVRQLEKQINQIINNQPILEESFTSSDNLSELQEKIKYLSSSLLECNEFLKCLAAGQLDVKPPGRFNFFAGSLKELHAGLRHITWQANQVANGDYHQTILFLGDFSKSFNQMILQLSERETRLTEQSHMLSETVEMMKSIMDGLKDWIIVTSKDTREVIYANQSARQLFYDTETNSLICGGMCGDLFYHFGEAGDELGVVTNFEYKCPLGKKIMHTKSFLVQWNDKLAYVHCMSDVTHEKEYQMQIEGMAFRDELTGLFNRRYCVGYLHRLLENNMNFSFCMIDLDCLKYVNDNFGHVEGDKYLKTVSEGLLSAVRSKDVVCRIGGDEFAILLESCTENVIVEKMKALDDQLASKSVEYPMSISYGVIQIPKGSSILSETVLALADEKMYLLKNKKKLDRKRLVQ